MTALTVTIPGVPDYDLSPNARGVSGWKRGRLVKAIRHEVAMELRCVDQRTWQLANDLRARGAPYVLDAVIAWPPGRKRLDDDNAWACLKAYRDQLAQWLCLNDAAISQGTLTQKRAARGDRAGSVTLTIRNRAFGEGSSDGA